MNDLFTETAPRQMGEPARAAEGLLPSSSSAGAAACLGCEYVEGNPQSLRDGRVVCTSCPDWRLECEARMVVNIPTKEARIEYLNDVAARRGKDACETLKAEVRALWSR